MTYSEIIQKIERLLSIKEGGILISATKEIEDALDEAENNGTLDEEDIKKIISKITEVMRKHHLVEVEKINSDENSEE